MIAAYTLFPINTIFQKAPSNEDKIDGSAEKKFLINADMVILLPFVQFVIDLREDISDPI